MKGIASYRVILAVCVALAFGCAQREAEEATDAARDTGPPPTPVERVAVGGAPGPVLLIGIDGFEWEIVLELIARGELPRIGALMTAGTYGLLETTSPTFSPIIWTTVATGKGRKEHGIGGFVRRAAGPDQPRRLFTSFDRRSKAFWNILSEYGKRVAVVGWWITYPVEEINGVMVAQVNTLDQTDRKYGKAILKGGMQDGVEGQVHPPGRLEEFLELHREVSDGLPRLTEEIFGRFSQPLSPLAARLWENTLWSFRSDATYIEISRRLAGEDFDLLAFYLGGPDVVGHRFWRYMRPERYDNPPSPAEIAEFGDVVADYYRYVDAAIGRVLDAMPASASVLIVSDHGMYATNLNQAFDPQEVPRNVMSAHHGKAPAGVIIASGPAFAALDRPLPARREDLRSMGSVLDVAPSLLALMGIPVGGDMAGKPLRGLFADPDLPLRSLPSHETGEWLTARSGLDGDGLAGSEDEDRLEQLRALGYIN